MNRRGIILSAGESRRLYPASFVISKQLLPIYDKPMIYYPLSILMLTGIKDIIIIVHPSNRALFEKLLGDGSKFGINISYAEQPEPLGIAQAFLIAEKFVDGNPSCLILGDNIFYGHDLARALRNRSTTTSNYIFVHHVSDPERFGVVEVRGDKIISIEEKPANPKSSLAVTGLYMYDKDVFKLVKTLRPSSRGEIEITDLNKLYLEQGRLQVATLGRGTAWFDTGTPTAMLEASNFIQTIEHRQGLKIGCLEEVAFRMGFIGKEQVAKLAEPMKNNQYGKYLLGLL